MFEYPNDIIYLTSQNWSALLKNILIDLAPNKVMKNGPVNKFLSPSKALPSLSWGSDGFILNIKSNARLFNLHCRGDGKNAMCYISSLISEIIGTFVLIMFIIASCEGDN